MKEKLNRLIKIFIMIFFLGAHFHLLLSFSFAPPLRAEMLDRVVAVVDDEIVLYSELEEAFQGAVDSGIDVTLEEVLNGLINRILLLKQAKKIRRKHILTDQAVHDDNVLINEYIERRLKSFIRIPYRDIEIFHEENRKFFSDDFYDVRGEIEAYLIELELNKRLKQHLKELKRKSYVRIQMERREE